ncbi:NUDIX hydrolase domain-like protein [Mrakia frigida]|uniref:NUDIX hydrolase n=1 Tax=Mrakia frigida TaxID=29902 RepID=UPI003FCC0E07
MSSGGSSYDGGGYSSSFSSVGGYTPTEFDGIEKVRGGEERRVVCASIPYDPASGYILLISSRKKEGRWTLPKGGKEANEGLEAATLREAWEEGGILGWVEELICSIPTARTDVHFYALQVSSLAEEWPEDERAREWVSPEDALVRVGWKEEQAAALQLFFSTRNQAPSTDEGGEDAAAEEQQEEGHEEENPY